MTSMQRKPADEDQGSLPKKQQATDAKIAAPPAKVQRSQRPVNKVEPGPVVKTSKKKTTFSSVRKDGRERIPQVVYPHELGYTNGGKKVGALCVCVSLYVDCQCSEEVR